MTFISFLLVVVFVRMFVLFSNTLKYFLSRARAWETSDLHNKNNMQQRLRKPNNTGVKLKSLFSTQITSDDEKNICMSSFVHLSTSKLWKCYIKHGKTVTFTQ